MLSIKGKIVSIFGFRNSKCKTQDIKILKVSKIASKN
jgi:hypothetical protein